MIQLVQTYIRNVKVNTDIINHSHHYSAGFLETLYVTRLIQLEQPDFVNPRL